MQVTKASKGAAVQRFTAVTGASSADAQQYLRESNYRLEAAVDAFFQQQSSAPRLSAQQEKEAASALNALFNEYRGTWHTLTQIPMRIPTQSPPRARCRCSRIS